MMPFFETELGRLYHADCLEVMAHLDLSGYALLIDPLYGENQNLQRSIENTKCPERTLRGLKLKRYDWPAIEDLKPLDPTPFLRFDQAIVWGGNYIADLLPASRCWIVWDKLHIPPDNHHDCEMAWTNLSGVSRVHRQLWRGICREGEENISNGPKLHPFQKPIRLMNFCLEQFKGDPPIFDGFAGSGTVAVSCERNNRPWVCVENSIEYCRIAAERIRKETGQLHLFRRSSI